MPSLPGLLIMLVIQIVLGFGLVVASFFGFVLLFKIFETFTVSNWIFISTALLVGYLVCRCWPTRIVFTGGNNENKLDSPSPNPIPFRRNRRGKRLRSRSQEHHSQQNPETFHVSDYM